MKILTVIDHFGSGGAQRQIVELACGLRRRGHDVHAFCYFSGPDYFLGRLQSEGVIVHTADNAGGFSPKVVTALRRLLRREQFHAVVAFLEAPAAYAELASLGMPVTLVVSERAGHHGRVRVRPYVTRLLHLRADRVVTNTHAHASWLRAHFPWLRKRTICVYNGVAPAFFVGGWTPPCDPAELQLIGIGRVARQKNLATLIGALGVLASQRNWIPHVHWAGRVDDVEYAAELDAMLERLPAVRERWRWLGEVADTAALLPRYHALILPSLFEGLPNALCESFAAGLPALASDVADHAVLIDNGTRGMLFDPHDPQSIANAIDTLAAQPVTCWRDMSRSAVDFARRVLDMDVMIGAYESLLGSSPAPAAVRSGPVARNTASPAERS